MSENEDSTADRLRPSWAKQVITDERSVMNALRHLKPERPHSADVGAILTWADQHLFERRFVVALCGETS